MPNTLFVASAGNIGDSFSFPLYPGAWPEVVNVAATYAHDSDQWWEQSNPGEVFAPGAYFDDGSAVYAGTSYAAHAVSLYSALRLAALDVAVDTCPFLPGQPPHTAYLPVFTPTSPEETYDRDCNFTAQSPSLLMGQTLRDNGPQTLTLAVVQQTSTALGFDLSALIPGQTTFPQVTTGAAYSQTLVDATFDMTGLVGYVPPEDEAYVPVYWGALGEMVGLYRRDKTLLFTLP